MVRTCDSFTGEVRGVLEFEKWLRPPPGDFIALWAADSAQEGLMGSCALGALGGGSLHPCPLCAWLPVTRLEGVSLTADT